jgi:putative endonuclease
LKGFVYILTNKNNSVLYTGVTSDLKDRIKQNKLKKHPDSFSARYNLNKLIYFETLATIGEAIRREKQIKGGSRDKKIALVNSTNSEWKDLSEFL